MSENWIALTPHPSIRSEAVRSIQVLARRPVGTELRLTYRLDGDVSRIIVPAPSAPRIGVELWRHTCFEAFVALEGQSSYHEFNFAPSREWTVYAMRGYRDGAPLSDESMRPEIVLRSSDDRLELDALVRLDRLSAAHAVEPLRVGLFAVIEANEGVSYWALDHRGPKPDFHDAGGFTLVIEPPDE
jgi:hypothetical protein